jgi:hypothetical protein
MHAFTRSSRRLKNDLNQYYKVCQQPATVTVFEIPVK